MRQLLSQKHMIKLRHIRRTARLLMHLSAQNLLYKRTRSALTIMGVVIGIGSVFMLLSFGLGLQQLVRDRIIGGSSMSAVTVTPANSKIISLDAANLKRLGQIKHVEKVGLTYSSASEITLKNANTDFVMFGVDKTSLELSNLQLQAGRTIDPENRFEVVVNLSLLEKVGIKNPASAINEKVSLVVPGTGAEDEAVKTQQFTIVGVQNSHKGSEAFVSEKVFEISGVKPRQVKLIADSQTNIPNIRISAEAIGFETTSPLDTLQQVNQVFRIFNILLVSLGSIGLVIAVIGMFNTLTISLLERSREIGLMVALGARQKDMKRLFISEALLISIVGGTVGVVGAIVLGMCIDQVFNAISRSRGATVQAFSLFAEPFWLLAATFLFMIALGYAVVFIPARRAASISPIDALRHD